MRARPLVLPLAAVLALLAACEEPRRTAPVPLRERVPAVDPARTIEGTLLVAGMSCSGCEYNVTSALELVPGVLDAQADHASGEARVRFDPERTTLARLAEAVRTAGYAVAPVEGAR